MEEKSIPTSTGGGVSFGLGRFVATRLVRPSLSIVDPMSATFSSFALAGLLAHRNLEWLVFVSLVSITNWLSFKSCVMGLCAKSHQEFNQVLKTYSPEKLALERVHNWFSPGSSDWGKVNSISIDFAVWDKGKGWPIVRDILIFAPTEVGPSLGAAKSFPSLYGISAIVLDTSMFDHDIGPNFTLQHELGHISNAGVLASIYEFNESGYVFWMMLSAIAASGNVWFGVAMFALLLIRMSYHNIVTNRAVPEVVADAHALWHLPTGYALNSSRAMFDLWNNRISSPSCRSTERSVLGVRARMMTQLVRAKAEGRAVFTDPRRLRLASTFSTSFIMFFFGLRSTADPQLGLIILLFVVLQTAVATAVYKKEFLSEHAQANEALKPFTQEFVNAQKSDRYLHLYDIAADLMESVQPQNEESLIRFLQKASDSPHRSEFETRVLNDLLESGQMPKEIKWPPNE